MPNLWGFVTVLVVWWSMYDEEEMGFRVPV